MFKFANKFKKEIEAQRSRFEKCCEWNNSEEHKRMSHLETLIIKTYGTVNIKINNEYRRIDESFTRDEYLEDFKVFFKPEVFAKLKDWCKEYVTLCEKEDEILYND